MCHFFSFFSGSLGGFLGGGGFCGAPLSLHERREDPVCLCSAAFWCCVYIHAVPRRHPVPGVAIEQDRVPAGVPCSNLHRIKMTCLGEKGEIYIRFAVRLRYVKRQAGTRI